MKWQANAGYGKPALFETGDAGGRIGERLRLGPSSLDSWESPAVAPPPLTE